MHFTSHSYHVHRCIHVIVREKLGVSYGELGTNIRWRPIILDECFLLLFLLIIIIFFDFWLAFGEIWYEGIKFSVVGGTYIITLEST